MKVLYHVMPREKGWVLWTAVSGLLALISRAGNFSLWHHEYVTNGFLYTVEPLSKYTPEMRTLFYFLQVQRNPDSIEVSVNSLRGMS